MSDDGDLTILTGGQRLSGWEEIEVRLLAEGFPNGFQIRASAPPGALPKAGDPCAVIIGSDLVITGYIDRDSNSGSADSHSLMLAGRGKTQDLVDCSAEWPSGQRIQGTALSISRNLAQAYGITVELGNGAQDGPKVPSWALDYGDTVAAIIQRLARNAGLLAYEDPSGKLILGALGTEKAASGITYGVNVQAWSADNSMNGRFSEIVCCGNSSDSLSDQAGSDYYDKATDPNVPRHRVHHMILEAVGEDPFPFTKKKALWMAARLAGQSTAVRATIDSWRDSAGKLWRPNTIVPVSVPGNRAGTNLVISEVTFRRNSEDGTVAELVLLPPSALVPEPLSLQPINIQDAQGPN